MLWIRVHVGASGLKGVGTESMKKTFGHLLLVSLLIGTTFSALKLPVGYGTSQLSINNAIQKGLAYLSRYQSSNGEWGSGDDPVASTAMAVLAFENAPNSHYGWNKTDPYSGTVQKGLNWLFSQGENVSLSNWPTTCAGDPDVSGTGIGVAWYGDGQPVYETPMVLMAVVASNSPTNVTIPGPLGIRTYHALVQDIVDWIAWAQNSNATVLRDAHDSQFEGGWRYQPQEGDSDNSVSQWPVLGLMAANLSGIKAPSWVQTELLKWTAEMQTLNSSSTYGASAYGAFDYQPGRGLDTPADTAAGILELTYCGANDTDPRIIAAEGYLNKDWSPNGVCPNGDDYGWNWNIGCLYDMYAVMKACRLTTPTPIQFIANYSGKNGVEWYNGTAQYADSLVANQSADGHWNNWVNWAEDINNDLGTAWGTLILEYVPVVVKYTLTVQVMNAYSEGPVSGAVVIAVGQKNRNGTTDVNGMVVFNKTLAGSYNVSASRPGYASAWKIVSLTNNTEITIKLTPLTYTLTVTVVDAVSMHPLAGAAVLATGPATFPGNTGSNGEIIFNSVQGGNYQVNASMKGYFQSALQNVSVTNNTAFTISLQPIPPTFEVNFTEMGLPYGTNWMVTLDGVMQSSATSVISFSNISSGIYQYSVGTLVLGGVGVRYIASPTAGSMSIPAQTTQSITFKTQYYLTMKTNVGATSPGSGWFDANSEVTISATAPLANAAECYLWCGWIGKGAGSCTGKSNPAIVTMDGPVSETATWSTIPIFLGVLMGLSILASIVFLMIITAFDRRRRKRGRTFTTHR